MKKIYSFDVFDTAITRVTGSPELAFLLIGNRLVSLNLIQCSPETFSRLRIICERRAKKNTGPSMALSDIYSEIEDSLFLTKQQSHKLMQQEHILQAELIRPVPNFKRRAEELRANGNEVIFVSDMHLSSHFIKEQLKSHDLWKDNDRCYVSCEHHKSKSSGELFPELLRIEDISASQLCHKGNDLHADVTSPMKAGISAEHFPEGNLNRFEEILESHAWSTNGFSSVMAGASRLARLAIPALTSKEAAIRDVSSGVVAPILVGYVLWLLKRAQQLNLKRIYFLSRDGQILLDIARKLIGSLDFNCELRYLYGSRLSWNRATIESLDEHWIWNPLSNACSLESLFNRLDIKQEEVIGLLNRYGFSISDWSRILGKNEVQLLQSALNEPDLKDFILSKSNHRKYILNKYFKQEKLFEKEGIGVVDLGWAGSMFSALSRLIDSDDETPLIGFYFGKNLSPNIDSECKRLEAYFFDERFNAGIIDNDIKNALELFCSADHGTVIGFEENNDHVVPILEKQINHELISWGLPILRDSTDRFIGNLVTDRSLVDPFADIRDCSLQLFRAFWNTPSFDEGKAWGSIRWEDHLTSHGPKLTSWSTSYKWSDVLDSLLQGRYPKHQSWQWIQGSIAQSPPSIQFLLKLAIKLGKKLGLRKN